MAKDMHAITGAFGYSGKYIAQELLEKDIQVITLTNSPDRENVFGNRIKAFPFNFQNKDELVESLKGVSVLYNTYWVRFNYTSFTHQEAVDNTKILFDAALKAGVRKIVHISITNPSKDTHLEYFSGKWELEEYLKSLGIKYSILRPTVIFGKEDILINNIAWTIRKFPIFGLFGDGKYRIQPIYVKDLAQLAVKEGLGDNNTIIDAIGPETYTYRELVEMMAEKLGKKRWIVSMHPRIGFFVSKIISMLLRDIFVTKEEIEGLMLDLLCTESLPAGKTALSEWMEDHADGLGSRYHSELSRRKDRKRRYV